MNTNRNTDRLFERMRNMPVEVPLENVEKFVIAQAALGITAVGASKGIFTKAFLKFHLNSILVMTTTITAALIGLALWTSQGDKIAGQADMKQESKHDYKVTLAPEVKTDVDTPRTTTTRTVTNGETTSVTTIETETGTNIKIVTAGNNRTSVYYNTPNDSTYTFAYANNSTTALPLPPLPPMVNVTPMLPLTPNGYCESYDALTSLIGKELFKDSIISDTAVFSFKMNGSTLVVNGEKQSRDHYDKYRELIENNTPYKFHRCFNFTVNHDDKRIEVGTGSPFDQLPAMEQYPMNPICPMPPAGFKNCNDTLMGKLEQAMLKDGLITDTLHYMFKINGSYLKVNGEKLSKEQWKKYKEIIESNSRNKVNRSFSYAIDKDGENISINVENFID